LRKWPFDSIAQIVRPDDTQQRALDELRNATAATAGTLTSDCPHGGPAPFSARLDEMAHGIDTVIAALDSMRPALQSFYAALDDEQKARLLLRGPNATALEAQARSWRREHRRADANGGHEFVPISWERPASNSRRRCATGRSGASSATCGSPIRSGLHSTSWSPPR
jgi:hypothetical protein